MKNNKSKGDSRQKIIDKSKELFYKQGYLATGINQIIAESGVAKNTFYYHFTSKDDLCISYLQEMNRDWLGSIKNRINSRKKPLDRLFAPLDFLKEWNENKDFRGCPFLNIVSEITDASSDIRKEVIYHKDGFKTIIRELIKDLKESDNRYTAIDIESTRDAYFLIVEGAIVTSQNYQDKRPFKIAKKNIEILLNQT